MHAICLTTQLFLVAITTLSMTFACSSQKELTINTRVWDMEKSPSSFPELFDSELRVPWITQRSSFGAAFSGGGTRSASATLGQLRALKKLGWLDKLQYISAISGGSWAAVPFVYLPASYDESIFLGSYASPRSLKKDILEMSTPGSLARAIHKSRLGLRYLREQAMLRGDESYSRTIGDIFLAPFDLNERHRFFSFHKGAFRSVQSENKKLDLKETDFYFVRDGRPYLIVGGTLLGTDDDDLRYAYQVEMTGLYTGIYKKGALLNKFIGGGYIESFAYDSKDPIQAGNRFVSATIDSRRHRFTLSDVIGISGAAPEHAARAAGLRNTGLPEISYWPVDLSTPWHEYPHGDGGHIDNLGLMPLLKRQVKNIIVFVNTPIPFSCSSNPPAMTDDIIGYFKQVPYISKIKPGYIHNIIFDESKLNNLQNGLCMQAKSNKTLVYCDKYTVKNNDHYGIQSYNSNICWVYLDRNTNWINLVMQGNLENKYKEQLNKSSDSFKHFPHYDTFIENKPFVIDLSAIQVNTLSHLTAWTLCDGQSEIAKNLTADGLNLSLEPHPWDCN